MPSLKGTEISPSLRDSPLDRLDIRQDKRKLARESLEKALMEWEALKNTPHHHVLTELAEPKVAHYRNEICKGILDFPGWPSDVVKEYQAECRGALREWLAIRDQPGMLKRQLDDLDKQEEDEKEVVKGPDVATKNKLKRFI